jgi:hypothetical protein
MGAGREGACGAPGGRGRGAGRGVSRDEAEALSVGHRAGTVVAACDAAAAAAEARLSRARSPAGRTGSTGHWWGERRRDESVLKERLGDQGR